MSQVMTEKLPSKSTLKISSSVDFPDTRILLYYRGGIVLLQLITDSSADLSPELISKRNISVVPMKINLEGSEYQEGVDITPKKFFEKMFASSELPKTSQPSPSTFAETFKALSDKGELLCLTISSGLSGTYQSACIGRDLSGTGAVIFDTLSGSLGHGFQLLKAAELAARGWSAGKVVEALDECRRKMNVLILLNTLENIVKGGRLSKFQGTIAKILDMKVLLEGINGKVEMLEKARGKKRFFERVLDLIGERKQDFSGTIFGITHADNPEDAEYLKGELIRRYNPLDVIINYMGATMGTYAGRGGMIISFY
jgi:DegV family protein with EDD domain